MQRSKPNFDVISLSCKFDDFLCEKKKYLLIIHITQGENLITEIKDLEKCTALKILHLRGNGSDTNQIETLEGFSKNMVALQYLNLRYDQGLMRV